MKILLAAAIYPPDAGGPATHAARFVLEVEKLGHEVRVVVFSKYHHLPAGIRHVRYFFALLGKVWGVDCIYAHDARSTGLPAYLVSILLRKPLILRIGGDVVWEKAMETNANPISMREFYKAGKEKGRLFSLVSRVFGRASKIIVTSAILENIYIDYYNVSKEKIIVLGNPISDVKVESFGRFNLDVEKALVFASRFVAYKNLDLLLDAFAAVYEEISPAKLYLCGAGPEQEKLETQTKRLGMGGQVIFSHKNHENVLELISKSWGTIAPALTEFNPNYLLEGLALGKPFLLSREHGLSFSVPEKLTFDPTDRKDLERKLVWFFSEEGYSEAKELIKNIQALPTWEENINTQLAIISSVVSDSPAATGPRSSGG